MPTYQHKTSLANSVEPTANALIIHLQNGSTVHIPWHNCTGKLSQATSTQRECLELSPSGNGIHWPLLDEDLSVHGLIRLAQSS